MNSSLGNLSQRILDKAAAKLEKALEPEAPAISLTVDEHLEKAAAILRAQGMSESKLFSTLRLAINTLEQSKQKPVAKDEEKETLRIGTTFEKFAKPFVSNMLMRSRVSRRAYNKYRDMKSRNVRQASRN